MDPVYVSFFFKKENFVQMKYNTLVNNYFSDWKIWKKTMNMLFTSYERLIKNNFHDANLFEMW